MAVLAFVPLAEAARPILVVQFDRYLKYEMPVEQPIDATTLVERIYSPITDDIADAAFQGVAADVGTWSFMSRPATSA